SRRLASRDYGLPFPPSVVVPDPSHAFEHVVPAAQSWDRPPLQLTWQTAVPPHSTEHDAPPLHSAVHPPFGHLIEQLLLPPHVTVDPVSTVTVQLLPPAHDTLLLVPVVSVHVLVPSQDEVQFDEHVPWHDD